MFTPEFWAENWIKLLFGLISTAIIGYVTFIRNKMKEHKNLISEKDDEENEEIIDQKIEEAIAPIKQELITTKEKFDVIKDSYKYRLIAMCEIYLSRGYLTSPEYRQLTEMWKIYHGLGGNSQAEDFYHKVEKLPVKD